MRGDKRTPRPAVIGDPERSDHHDAPATVQSRGFRIASVHPRLFLGLLGLLVVRSDRSAWSLPPWTTSRELPVDAPRPSEIQRIWMMEPIDGLAHLQASLIEIYKTAFQRFLAQKWWPALLWTSVSCRCIRNVSGLAANSSRSYHAKSFCSFCPLRPLFSQPVMVITSSARGGTRR